MPPLGPAPKDTHPSNTDARRRPSGQGARRSVKGAPGNTSPPAVNVTLRVVGELDSRGTRLVIVEAPASWSRIPHQPVSTLPRDTSGNTARLPRIESGAHRSIVDAPAGGTDSQRDDSSPGLAELARALTARELQISALVAAGKLNKQIATLLRISEFTVSTHMRRIYSKLGIRSRSSLAAMYAVALSECAGARRRR